MQVLGANVSFYNIGDPLAMPVETLTSTRTCWSTRCTSAATSWMA
jgi:hypothetical protein